MTLTLNNGDSIWQNNGGIISPIVCGDKLRLRDPGCLDWIELYHDGGAGYIKWNDGNLVLQTDEGTNTRTSVGIAGKGTGGSKLTLWGADSANEAIQINCGSLTSSFTFGPNTDELVFNEDGVDVDFRFESDVNEASLFVQGSNGFIGINDSTPEYVLDVNAYSGLYGLNLFSDAGAAAVRPGIRQECLRTPGGIAYSLFEGYIGEVHTNPC